VVTTDAADAAAAPSAVFCFCTKTNTNKKHQTTPEQHPNNTQQTNTQNKHPKQTPNPKQKKQNTKQQCKADLAAAEPVIAEAEAALNSLDKASLGELKSFGSPAAEVVQVCCVGCDEREGRVVCPSLPVAVRDTHRLLLLLCVRAVCVAVPCFFGGGSLRVC
jgi:hypothetical protein